MDVSRYGMLLKGTRRGTTGIRTLQSVLNIPFTVISSRTSKLLSSRGVADTTYKSFGIGCLTWRGKLDGFVRRSDAHGSSTGSSRIGATVLDVDELKGPFIPLSDGFDKHEDEDSGREKDMDSDEDEDEDGDNCEREYGNYEFEGRVDERRDSEDESKDEQRYGRDECKQEFSEDKREQESSEDEREHERFKDNELESEDKEREQTRG